MLSDADPEKAKRATEAMYAMKKLDIAALEKRARGRSTPPLAEPLGPAGRAPTRRAGLGAL